MMHQSGRWLTRSEGLVQCCQRQPRRQGLLQRPAHDLAREAIENHGQIDELRAQANVGDVRPLQLIETGQREPAGEIEIHLKLMLCVRRGDKGPRLNGQQGVLSHEPGDALMIHQQAAPP